MSNTEAIASTNHDRTFLRDLARRLSDLDFGTGALASLRRGDPAVVQHQPSFHRLVRDLDDAALGADGALRWATAVHLLALVARSGSAQSRLDVGSALAQARFPESRLGRLLASRGETLRDQAVLAAKFIHAHDIACAATDLAELALVDGRAERRAERLRLRIARAYYRTTDTPADLQ